MTKHSSTPSANSGIGANIYLVSCVGKKVVSSAPAKDLYDSDWFRKARAFVERQGGPWFILSAEHGLVEPHTRLAPYDKTLNAMSATEQREWAEKVLRQLEWHLDEVEQITFLAGRHYREFLSPKLQERGLTVEIPMEGLKIGEQLAWLKSRT